MDTPWLEFQAFLNGVWTRVESTGRIWELLAFPSSGLASLVQMFLIGLPRLQLIQQMLRIHARCYKCGSIADHHQKSFFATFVDGSHLIQVDDPAPGRWLGHRSFPAGDQFGDRALRQLALKDPSFLRGRPGDCDP